LRLRTLIPILEGADSTPNWQPAQDIVGCHAQALGIMAATGRRQATLRIERLPHGCSGWQGVGRPIESEDRQAAPLILLARRQYLIRERDQAAEQDVQDLPGQFGSRFGQRTAVRTVLVGPQATPTRSGKERGELGRDTCVSSTGGQSDKHDEQMGQRELAATGEVLGAGHGDRLHKVQEQGEQAFRELGRSRRFFASSSLILVQMFVYASFDVRCSHKAVS